MTNIPLLQDQCQSRLSWVISVQLLVTRSVLLRQVLGYCAIPVRVLDGHADASEIQNKDSNK